MTDDMYVCVCPHRSRVAHPSMMAEQQTTRRRRVCSETRGFAAAQPTAPHRHTTSLCNRTVIYPRGNPRVSNRTVIYPRGNPRVSNRTVIYRLYRGDAA